MTDKIEVVLLVNGSGAKREFAAVGAEAAKTAAALKSVGTAGAEGLAKTEAAAAKTAAGMTKVGNTFTRFERFASGAAVAGIIGFLSDSARAAADAEASVALLDQAMENAGTSSDAYAESLDNAAKKALALGFDDEAALEAIGQMVTITGNATQAITDLGLAEDIARERHVSLATAATLVGKVEAGNIAILSRYGIVLDKNATTEEAMAALRQKFAGQAAAYANTQRGAIDRLAVGWENLQETVGGAAGPFQAVLGILPGVSAGFVLVAGTAAKLTEALPPLEGNLGKVTLGLGLAGAALGAGVALWKANEDAVRSTTAAYADAAKEIGGFGDASQRADLRDLLIDPDEVQALGQEVAQAIGEWKVWETGPKLRDLTDNTDNWNAAIGKLPAVIQRTGASEQELVEISDKLLASVKSGALGLGDAADVIDGVSSILANSAPGADAGRAALAKWFAELEAGTLTPLEFGANVRSASADLVGFTDELGAGADAVRAFSDAQSTFVSSLPGKLRAAGAASVAAVKDQQSALVDAAETSADAASQAAERAGRDQSRAASVAGHEASRQAELAGRSQVREAELAEVGQTRAAENAAASQIAAAQDAEDAQVEAAQKAADAQVEAAERAAEKQIRAAEQAGHAQIREATTAAHDQVRAANLAAAEQERAADHLEESVAASAKAREESIVDGARAEADAAVEAANKRAEAEIAAAKRSTEKQLFELERRTAANSRAASAETGEAIQRANDAAFRAIKGGAPIGKVTGNLAKAERDAFAKEVKAQEDVLRQQEAAQQRIQDDEDRRIAAANAAKEAAAEASAQRVAAIEKQAAEESAARTEAASREAEQMRTQAARDASQVEKATAQDVARVTRAAAQDAARVTKQTAQETARVQEQSAENVKAVQEAAAANTAAVTERANAEAERVATQAARNTERVRTEAERNVRLEARKTEREQTTIARNVEREQTAAAKEVEKVKLQAAANVKAAEEEAKDAGDATILALANGNDEAATLLEQAGEIQKGASGAWEITVDPASQAVINQFNALFGSPDGQPAQLDAHGQITIDSDWTQFVNQVNAFNADPPQVAVEVVPTAARSNPNPQAQSASPSVLDQAVDVARKLIPVDLVPHRHGGVVNFANGGLVHMNEGGRGENVILPDGSLIISHPASQASNAGLAGVTLQFNGPVYGFDDFKDQVGQAALEALAHALPQALDDRRHALGAA